MPVWDLREVMASIVPSFDDLVVKERVLAPFKVAIGLVVIIKYCHNDWYVMIANISKNESLLAMVGVPYKAHTRTHARTLTHAQAHTDALTHAHTAPHRTAHTQTCRML